MITPVVDLGGTAIKAGIVRDGKVIARREIDAQARLGLEGQLPRLESLVRDLCAEVTVQLSECAGLGISFPGLIEPRAGRILSAPSEKYEDGPSVDLHAWARERLGLPVRIENDAHAALLGEWKFGGGRGVDDFIMVTLGTGIGTSVLIGGKPLRGKHHQAGVLGGHFIIVPNGRLCICGARGCVETECASRALPEIAREIPEFNQSRLARERDVDFAAVFRLAADGDRVALLLRNRCLDYWGALLATLVHAYDPERIVVGGGIMRSADVIIPHLQKFTDANTWTAWGKAEIVPAAAGNDACLLGLAVLFSAQLEYL